MSRWPVRNTSTPDDARIITVMTQWSSVPPDFTPYILGRGNVTVLLNAVDISTYRLHPTNVYDLVYNEIFHMTQSLTNILST